MAKARSVFFCSACGHESTRWLGRCPACEAWNSFAEAPAPPKPSRPGNGSRSTRSLGPAEPMRLGDVETAHAARTSTGMPEFDALLGGGVVPGSLVLVG